MNLSIIELVIFLFWGMIAGVGTLLLHLLKHSSKKLFSILLFGIAAIFLFAGLITPPDVVSTFIIALPATIVYAIVATIKFK